MYTSLESVTETVNMKTPTLAQYSQLYNTYSQTLTCECTTISINYGTFLHVEYTFHQVCSSIFVSESWINYLAASYGSSNVFIEDFRWTGTYTFQALSALCALINKTISNSLTDFYSSEYISAYVISSELFQLQVQSLTDQFRLSTTNAFLLSLSMIRGTTQGNALLSGLQTNYDVLSSNDHRTIFTATNIYSDCYCDTSPTCTDISAIYKSDYQTILYTVPGMYTGCYVIESLLQSTLQCFYDQTCINQLQSYFLSSATMYITALHSSLPTQYFINSTIEDLLDHLMVEQWNSSHMYENYYNACHPAQCTYTHQAKNNIIYIVTTLIGLVGGLITVLKLLVPQLVKFVRRKN